jgi:hypothetical protein
MLWELLKSLALSRPRAARLEGSSLSLLDRRGFVRGDAAAEEAALVEFRGGYMVVCWEEGRGARWGLL